MHDQPTPRYLRDLGTRESGQRAQTDLAGSWQHHCGDLMGRRVRDWSLTLTPPLATLEDCFVFGDCRRDTATAATCCCSASLLWTVYADLDRNMEISCRRRQECHSFLPLGS